MQAFPVTTWRALAVALVAMMGCHAVLAEAGERGTEGLSPLPFTASNASERPIACTVATAHYYAVDLGTAAPHATVARTFWVDPATGTVFVLNTHQDRMPVEEMWCGFAGRAWATRAAIDLGARAGQAPRALHVTCRKTATGLRCSAI